MSPPASSKPAIGLSGRLIEEFQHEPGYFNGMAQLYEVTRVGNDAELQSAYVEVISQTVSVALDYYIISGMLLPRGDLLQTPKLCDI